MSLNKDRIGHSYLRVRYEVSRQKIREYALALGETDPRYFSDGPDCVAPPTFAACFTIMFGGDAMRDDPDLGFHHAVVHGSQAFEFGDRIVRPSDALTCTPKIADIRWKGSNEFLTVEIDCRFEDTGERAVLSRGVIVLLGSAPQDEAA